MKRRFKENDDTENEGSFWISYTDLLTGFLIIFIVITLSLSQTTSQNSNCCEEANTLKHKIDSLKGIIRVTEKQFETIERIEKALSTLNKSPYFLYNQNCERFELRTEVLFTSYDAKIPKKQEDDLIKAGRELQQVIEKLSKIPNIVVKVVIEGRAAKEEPNQTDGGKLLSYRRALALYELWVKWDKLDFGKAEVFTSGSGFEGQCRYKGAEEGRNKNFIVQIIPYIKK